VDKYINELVGPQYNGDLLKSAQYAKTKRAVGARYIVTAPGMETEWCVNGPNVHKQFATEQEAKDFAASKDMPSAVYPVFGHTTCPFGSVIVWGPHSDYGPNIMTVGEFNAEWEDYIPTAEEMVKIKAEEKRREEANGAALVEKLNAAGTVTNGEPSLEHHDDTFTETIDPIAPDGPGNPPGVEG